MVGSYTKGFAEELKETRQALSNGRRKIRGDRSLKPLNDCCKSNIDAVFRGLDTRVRKLEDFMSRFDSYQTERKRKACPVRIVKTRRYA